MYLAVHLGCLKASAPHPHSLSGELHDQNQERDYAADESDRPDSLLQERLISVNGIVAVNWLSVHPAVHQNAPTRPVRTTTPQQFDIGRKT